MFNKPKCQGILLLLSSPKSFLLHSKLTASHPKDTDQLPLEKGTMTLSFSKFRGFSLFILIVLNSKSSSPAPEPPPFRPFQGPGDLQQTGPW